MIAAYILIQTGPGKAAVAAAALRDVPGVAETASLVGPTTSLRGTSARDIGELAKLVASQVQALGGVTRTMTCPVLHL